MERRRSPVTFPRPSMARLISLVLLFAGLTTGGPAQAAGRYIVRVANGSAIQPVCLATGYTLVSGIDGTGGQLYVLAAPDLIDPAVGFSILSNTVGVVAVEPDLAALTADTAAAIPQLSRTQLRFRTTGLPFRMVTCISLRPRRSASRT
jgi:hypothetical protein